MAQQVIISCSNIESLGHVRKPTSVISEDYQTILVDDILRQKDTGNFYTAKAYFNG